MADENPTPASPAPTETPASPAPAPTVGESGEGSLLGGAAESTSTTEGQAKPEGETSGEGNGEGEDPGKQAKPEGAPETYDFKMPEGAHIDPVVLEQYAEVAKELNLSQADAQKLVDKIGPAMAERQAEAIKSVQTEWLNATKSDKEIGGDKLTESVGIAQKALTAFGTPELKTLLDQSGLGNHPEVIRMLWKAGQSISEDKFVSGHRSPHANDALDKLYPSQK